MYNIAFESKVVSVSVKISDDQGREILVTQSVHCKDLLQLLQNIGKGAEAVYGKYDECSKTVMKIRPNSTWNKIQTIKIVREVTGLGLKDAKDLVEDNYIFGKALPKGSLFGLETDEKSIQAIFRALKACGAEPEIVAYEYDNSLPAARSVYL